MKYSIQAPTIEPQFIWEQDSDGDWQLSYKNGDREKDYWGMVCPHHEDYYQVVRDGRLNCHFPKTLDEAKRKAEEMCAGDILRNLAIVKIGHA